MAAMIFPLSSWSLSRAPTFSDLERLSDPSKPPGRITCLEKIIYFYR